MMLYPPPDRRELGRIYDENYWLLNGSDRERRQFTQLKQETAQLYLDVARRCRGEHGGRLLEIGCGTGELLSLAAELGYEVTGVELSESSCARARDRLGNRGRIICGDISNLEDKGDRYDVCIIADVIEHILDPRSFIESVYNLLRIDGIVIIATPSLDSWSARFMRSRWMEFKPEHIHYFSQETLHSLLFHEGLEPIAALPGHKCLSLDYIADHFRKYHVPLFSFLVRHLSLLLPSVVRQASFKVTASGVISVAVKVPKVGRRKLSIIVPTYNEASTIGPVLEAVIDKQLEGLDKEIIIVESNSTDGTRETVLKYISSPGVKVILEEQPNGKGHAVRNGLAHATGDYILIQDGDQEYDIEDYDVLIEPLVSGVSAFILGSRHGGRTWKVRRFKGKPFTGLLLNFGHWVFKTAVNIALRLDLDDPFTMYKLFRRDCITGVDFVSNRFDFDYELLFKIVRKGYRPVEIPVNYRSRSFSEGKKVSVIRDPWTWIRAILKFRWEHMDPLKSWQCRRTKQPSLVAGSDQKDEHARDRVFAPTHGSRRAE